MRWHHLVTKWVLLITNSSNAYQSMREPGFINLPSEKTLYDYSHCIPSKLGFVPECNQKGFIQWGMENVIILQEEIKIRLNLVLCPTTGQLIGFVHLDDTSNQIAGWNVEHWLTDWTEYAFLLNAFRTELVSLKAFSDLGVSHVSDQELKSESDFYSSWKSTTCSTWA